MSQTTIVVAETTTEAPAATDTHGAGEATAAGESGHTEGTAAEGGHGGAFPPMDTATFPSQLFWLVIFFGALYYLMSKVALPRIKAILDMRHGQIQSDLAKAQALKTDAEKAQQAYEALMVEARNKASALAAETRERLAEETEAKRKALDAQLTARLQEAEKRINAMKMQALKDVQSVAAESAQMIVAELTGSKVSKDAALAAITKAED
jgi:F-type H+-transporting ATPase subunit b